jgi:membrane protein YdbS with pleckstrin-like domain
MAFPRNLLTDKEDLVVEMHPHWIALVGPTLVTILVAIIWILVLPNVPFSGGSVHSVLVWVIWIAGIVALCFYPVREFVAWATSLFVVTSDRIIHRRGLIARRSMEIPLEAINDVRFEQSVIQRMVGAGTLVISSASEQGREAFENIRNPEAVQKIIYEQGEKNQQRMFGGTKAAPMGGAGTGTGPAPAAAPAASAAPAPSATEELARLADLRDRGALTQEEFDIQKAKILGTETR